MRVPNQLPTVQVSNRLAVIGEAPGVYEDAEGKPFVGPSGNLLTSVLNNLGVSRHTCFVGNLCQHRPPNNKFEAFGLEYPLVKEGIEELTRQLNEFNPNAVLLLGAWPLHVAIGEHRSISEYRGTVFVASSGPFAGRKCIACYHPAYVLRNRSTYSLFYFDCRRAVEECSSARLPDTERKMFIDLPFDTLVDEIECTHYRGLEGTPLSFDIEGGVHSVSCYSFATSPWYAFVVPLQDKDGNHMWTPDQEATLWSLTSKLLADSRVTFIMQNAMYEAFVLAYSYGIQIHGLVYDTMLAHWEMYSEFDKGLGFQASIYTKEPPYKFERKADDWDTFLRYNAKDSCVTYECALEQVKQLNDTHKGHLKFNLDMLSPLLYMELRGMLLAKELKVQKMLELNRESKELNKQINELAGYEVNPASTKQMKELLYGKLGLEEQKNRITKKATTAYESLLKLAKDYQHPVVLELIHHRKTTKRHSILKSLSADVDGRVRCSYNVVGTDTGRVSCSQSATGSGTNLQTIPKYDRDLFLADENHWIFECDLSGADGWTVAAHCAALGDSTMLEDYLYGIKPAKVLALLIQGEEVPQDRQGIKEACKTITSDQWEYFCAKKAQHGSNYGVGPLTMAKSILKDSAGKVVVPVKDVKRYQALYFKRYSGVRLWHDWVAKQVKEHGKLKGAGGHTRVVFGPRNDDETLRAVLADEPQQNTTWVTNQLALNMWNDPSNRYHDGTPRVEVLHQVHDAIIGQIAKVDIDYLKMSIFKWADITIHVHGIPVKIPYEGAYGSSWGQLTEGEL